jgi:hypothetical protein
MIYNILHLDIRAWFFCPFSVTFLIRIGYKVNQSCFHRSLQREKVVSFHARIGTGREETEREHGRARCSILPISPCS